MTVAGTLAPSDRSRGAAGFAAAVLRAVTLRSVVTTQALGLLIALFNWLELLNQSAPAHGLSSVTRQVLAAFFMMLAGLAGDEAVRRGWPVWRAFVVALLCAASATAVAQSVLCESAGIAASSTGLLQALNTFIDVGLYWGMVLMVYLNRQSTARMLAGVRAGELERAQAERKLVTSRLAAAEMQIDSGSLLRQLAHVRDIYAAGRPGADQKLEELIADLRGRVVSSAAATPRSTPTRHEVSP